LLPRASKGLRPASNPLPYPLRESGNCLAIAGDREVDVGKRPKS